MKPQSLRYRPISTVHRGVLQTRRCWAPDPLYEGVRERERLLSLWQPGTIFRRGPGGTLVEWPSPRTVDTRCSAVLALLEQDGRFSSAPLHPSDIAAAPPRSVVLLQHGQLLHFDPSELPVEDPATWLDLGPLEISKVEPLGDPPAPAVVTVRVDNLQKVFGVSRAPGVPGHLPMPMSPSLARGATGRALGAAAAQLGRWLKKAPVPRWVADRGSWLERWGDKLGLTGALSSLFGLQHAQYLRDLMMRFDDGDWLGGIQHAIPLRGSADPSALPSLGPALEWLRPKGVLEFGATGPDGGRSVPLATDLFDKLKELYRKAFEALDQQRRYKEAAYVLAELLGETEEALTYLEKLGEFQLAAELAEAKGLDPARLVFLWLRAGDQAHALGLARLYSAWAAAVEHFKRRNLPQPAEWLRLEWAEHLARSGRYAAAVEVAWGVPQARQRAEGWLEEAVSAGGIAGARALARALELLPEPSARWTEAVRALLQDRTADGPLARAQLARSLPSNGAGRRVALALTRQLLRDAPQLEGSAPLIRQCAALAADGGLLVDLPHLPPGEPRPEVARLSGEIASGDTGTLPVLDAVALPRDRVLVALGELGARLLGPDGDTLATFAHPTHRMVPSPDGRRVLLLGQRGSTYSIARLDPVTRTLTRWCEAMLDAFCDEFDGSLWFVAQQGRVMALDVHARGLSAGWSLDLARRHGPQTALLLSWAPEALQIVASPQPLWYTAALPSLSAKLAVSLSSEARPVWAGGKALLYEMPPPSHQWNCMTEDKLELPMPKSEPLAIAVTGRLAVTAVAVNSPRGVEVETWGGDDAHGQKLRLEGASRAALRIQRDPSLLVVTDDLGRVRVIDLVSWRTRVDLRL